MICAKMETAAARSVWGMILGRTVPRYRNRTVTKVNGPTLSSSPYVSDAPFVLLTLGVPAALRSLPVSDEPCVATELEEVDPTDASEIFRRIPSPVSLSCRRRASVRVL